MRILDLAAELVDHILYFCILSRGIPRALRLKLVCKTFNAAFNRTLFHTGVLDAWASDALFQHWHTRKYHGADRLWYDYLVFNCRKLRKSPNSLSRRSVFIEIRDVANALLRHYESQEEEDRRYLALDTILGRLCWLALDGGTKASSKSKWRSEGTSVEPSTVLGLNLLAAATYFECEALVRDLLGQGHDPTAHSDLFPSPMYIAGWTGQAKLLQLMQENLPEFEDPEPTNARVDFRSKIGPGSLEGAAVRGDIEMIRLALYPPSRAIQSPSDANGTGAGAIESSSSLVLGEIPGSVEPGSKLGSYLTRAMRMACTPEAYQYLQSFLNEDLMTRRSKNMDLTAKVVAGDVVMVRHLLEIGADPSPKDTDIAGPPLMHAVRGWHEDVIDVLLEHGADPNERGRFRLGTLLTAAATAGSMDLLRKLLDAGVEIDAQKDEYTLWRAVRREHMAMVEMLLRMGVGSERGRRNKARIARDEGLDSMAELLETWVTGGGPPESQ